MSCDCHGSAEQIQQRSVLVALLIINGFMFLVEIVLGILADSTGLIADSLDMLADATVYGISLYAVGRAASVKLTAARLSGYLQIALAIGVFLDIGRRFIFGSEPVSTLMFAVGLVALAANVACLMLLAKHRKAEVHMRASWIFSKNDVIANLGVIAAAILVYFSGSRWPDLAIGLVIVTVVFRGGIEIMSEAKKASK